MKTFIAFLLLVLMSFACGSKNQATSKKALASAESEISYECLYIAGDCGDLQIKKIQPSESCDGAVFHEPYEEKWAMVYDGDKVLFNPDTPSTVISGLIEWGDHPGTLYEIKDQTGKTFFTKKDGVVCKNK